jgi:hypothetical protein
VLTHLGAPHKPVFDAPQPVPEAPPTGTDATGRPGGRSAGAAPGTAPATRRRRLNLLLDHRQGLRKARGTGISAIVGCSARCSVRIDLVVDRVTQRRYGLASRRIGRRTFVIKIAGRRPLRIQLAAQARRRLRHARSLPVSVQATWTGVRPALRRSGSVRLR